MNAEYYMMDNAQIFDVIETVSKSVMTVDTCSFKDNNVTFSNLREGSGFVILDGYMITNSHVVGNGEKVCILKEGVIMEGNVLNRSKILDLALIEVNNKNWPVLKLGDSDKIRIGQAVYLIGNSLGIKGPPSVTSGIISAVNRSIRTGNIILHDLIQTDASLNMGNSGGPLIDESGNVIGVATALVVNAQGVGFGVPSNTVREYIKQVITHGKYSLPWIGVEGITITPQISNQYQLGVKQGVLVTNVIKESPAEKAGLLTTKSLLQKLKNMFKSKKFTNPLSQIREIIISINDHEVEDFEDFRRYIRSRKIGDVLELEVIQAGSKKKFNVKVSAIV